MWLLLCLATIAGAVDVAVFLGCGGVFTAHITGNVALVSEHSVQQTAASVLLLAVLPGFIAGVTAARLLAAARPGLRPGLMLHAGLLLMLAICVYWLQPTSDGNTGATLLVGMLAAFSMGVQNAVAKLLLPHAPSTAVMTSNVTQTVMALIDLGLGGDHRAKAKGQLPHLVPCVVGFAVGCAVSTAGYDRFRLYVLVMPALLGLVALLLPKPA